MTCGQQRCSPEGLRARAAFGGGDALGRSRGSAAQLSSLLAFADAQAGQGSVKQQDRGSGSVAVGRVLRSRGGTVGLGTVPRLLPGYVLSPAW